MAEKQKELGGQKLSTPAKIIIVLFAVIMALSMMLPMFASVFAKDSQSEKTEQAETTSEDAATDKTATDEAATDKEAKDAEAEKKESDVPDNEQLKNLADTYTERVERYQARLDEDPDNLAALLNLGQAYMSWGYSANYSSTTDEEKAYSKGLLDKATAAFDSYLKLNDATAVKVDRALITYYGGDTDKAVSDLEALSKEQPDSALVWANLAMLYESSGNTDKASETYQKAIDCDPNDEYGAKSYANQRLISLNKKLSSPADAGEASVDNIETNKESGLTSTLNSSVGLDL